MWRRADGEKEMTAPHPNAQIADLPDTAAPQAALELVVRELAVRQPWFMRLIMEDAEIREAYEDAVASTPLKAKGK